MSSCLPQTATPESSVNKTYARRRRPQAQPLARLGCHMTSTGPLCSGISRDAIWSHVGLCGSPSTAGNHFLLLLAVWELPDPKSFEVDGLAEKKSVCAGRQSACFQCAFVVDASTLWCCIPSACLGDITSDSHRTRPSWCLGYLSLSLPSAGGVWSHFRILPY